MGLAVAMALFLLAVAIVLGAALGVAWGVSQATRRAYVAARGALRRGHS